MRLFKKLINLVAGGGPNRVRTFRDVTTQRRDVRRGVHQPELFDGVLSIEEIPALTYGAGTSLLAQPDEVEMIDGRRRYRNGGIVAPRTNHVYLMSDGGTLGSEGLVYCPFTRTAVAESMRCWTAALDDHPALSAPRMPAAKKLPGATLVLPVLSGEGFYHFFLEELPKLWLTRTQLPNVDRVLANGRNGSFHAQWLARAGVPDGKIVWTHPLSHFHSDQLIFTDHVIGEQCPTPWVVSALHQLLDAAPPAQAGRRHIWISRADAKVRQPAWETDLLQRLPSFEAVTLATMTPQEQIQTMREASVVAAPHGAGLCNILFCAAGTKVIELFPNKKRQPVYSRIADVCGLAYAWAVSDFSAPTAERRLADAINRFIET